MAFEYKLMLDDDTLRFVKRHGKITAIAQGMVKRRDGGAWENVIAIEIVLEPNEAQRLKDDMFLALREFFTNYYADLVEAYAWLDETTWSAEELTIPELEP